MASPLTRNKEVDKDSPPAHKRSGSYFFSLLALLELALGGVYLLLRLPFALFLIGHIAILGVMAMTLLAKRNKDLTRLVLGFVVIMVAGPLGAAGYLLFNLLMRRSKISETLLNDWYRRLSDSVEQTHQTQKFQSIHNGRAAGLGNVSVENFHSVMTGDNVKNKQVLLGIIALKYQPEYLPSLELALKDNEPTVRVQAAAAFTKLRDHFKTILKQNREITPLESRHDEDHSKDGKALSHQVVQLSSCVQSGLFDSSEIRDTEAKIMALYNINKAKKYPPSLKSDLVFSQLLHEQGNTAQAVKLLKPHLLTGNKDVARHYTQYLLTLRRFDEIAVANSPTPPLNA